MGWSLIGVVTPLQGAEEWCSRVGELGEAEDQPGLDEERGGG